MNYFNKSKLKIIPQLENNYNIILNDFNNFDYNYTDKLSKIKIDNIFNKWNIFYKCKYIKEYLL